MQVNIQSIILIALLFLISIIDIKKRIIPNSLCIVILLLCLIDFKVVNLLGILPAVIFCLFSIHEHEKIGGGDVKLTGAVGMVIGLEKSIAGVIIGLTAMLIFYGIYRIVQCIRQRHVIKAFPLAPFLSIGYTIVILYL